MTRLLDCLQQKQRWQSILEWSERWIALGRSPEPAFRALMRAHCELGDMSQVGTVYQRCENALREDLGVEPSQQTRALFEQLKAGRISRPSVPLLDQAPAPGEPPFKGLQYFDEADADLFFGRERLTAKLAEHLRDQSFLVIIGASGSGKSSLVRAGLDSALKHMFRLASPCHHADRASARSARSDADPRGGIGKRDDDADGRPGSRPAHVCDLTAQGRSEPRSNG